MSKHKLYYQSKGKKPGRTPSQNTLLWKAGEWWEVSNEEVVTDMHAANEEAEEAQGYQRMCAELQLRGYLINRKKVYRLMKEYNMLRPKRKAGGQKQYVHYRIVMPEEPLQLIEMDIKQVWIEGKSRPAFILTILEVFTRTVLYWTAGYQMKNHQVRRAWQQVIEHVLQPLKPAGGQLDIEVRCDNGPQFVANELQKFLRENYLQQTFTHPYTPQENGHIESFHAILGKELDGRYFDNLEELERTLKAFYMRYNYQRVHSGCAMLPPATFWKQWSLGNIERTVIDQAKRKVKFKLKKPRWLIDKVQPAGNESLREVLSLDFLGLDAPGNPKIKAKQSGGAALRAQPAV